jgi:hypothetical protein
VVHYCVCGTGHDRRFLCPTPASERRRTMPTTYRITTRTGAVEYAGTDSYVYITLFGDKGNSGERLLDNADNNFERGRADVFSIEMRDIGEIKRVRIKNQYWGQAPGWFLEDITVHNEDSDQEWTFPCHRWLAFDADDGKTDRILDAQ